MRSYTRELVIVAVLLTAIGAGLTLWGASESRRLTGEWIGYPLPTVIAGASGIGVLATMLGLTLLVAIAVASIADRTAIRRVLNRSLFAEDSAVAKVGRSILRAQKLWDVGVAVLLIGLLLAAAFQDRLVAIILGITALLVLLIYLFAKRESTNGEHVV